MSYKLTAADLVWNRAAMENGGVSPASGDAALSSLLYAHGLVSNGGVLHAVEIMTSDEFSEAQEGYRFFDLDAVASLLSHAKYFFDLGERLSEHECRLNNEYLKLVPDDSLLSQHFELRFNTNPWEFAPIK
ncbi:hypothetical protein [Rubinisphaera italica]|uniref:Uncharacterized protein n=1 Tax=Rubinisphaera italica TaxID=2527969 RepID=A0A5C5XEP4_9PLAN|nr:hypothetical protein [Rubinisphaera italica]TWT61264.1 hypothetical protein Pan54_20000 [Rubinisphaera italica]